MISLLAMASFGHTPPNYLEEEHGSSSERADPRATRGEPVRLELQDNHRLDGVEEETPKLKDSGLLELTGD